MTRIYFSDSRRKAILAEAIRAGCEMTDARDMGRIALQKIPYFLQRRGVPLRYSFDLFHYGPLCTDIYFDLEDLLADDVIRDTSDDPKRSRYRPHENMDVLLGKFTSDIAPYRESIADVLGVLAPFEPRRMELLATLDYIHQQERAKLLPEERGDLEPRVVSRFLEVKKDKFARPEVEKCYREMKAKDLLLP